MNFISVRAVHIALAVLVASFSLHAQSQSPTQAAKPTGSISGRITVKGKGVAGFTVSIRSAESANPFETQARAISDQDGNYRITNVPAGSYDVTPGNQAFVVAGNNNSRSRNIIVAENENVENINFTMVRGGVITGRITDADGRPVIQQQVRLIRAETDAGSTPQARIASPAYSGTTDDRGIYRIFGLQAGNYKVATGRSNEMFTMMGMPGRSSYKEVFYPDTPDSTKAKIIEVAEGSEASNIDIALGRVTETFSASGKVVDGEKGLPIPNARFGLQRVVGDRPEYINAFITSDRNGNFVAESLIPGKYSAFLFPDPNNELRVEATTFEIIDGDVSGITVRLVKGASISGVVVLESEDQRAMQRLTQLQILGYVRSQSGINAGSGSRSAIGADGSFRIAGLSAGNVNLNLVPFMDPNVMKGLSVSRIERDGVVIQRGFDIKEGEQISGVRIFVIYGTSSLRGVVNVANGTLPPNARLIVRITKPGDPSSNTQTLRIDERGRFVAEGLPAGTYEISVIMTGGGTTRRPLKQLVTLQEGVASDVSITLDLAVEPGP